MGTGSKKYVSTYRVTWKKFGRRNRGAFHYMNQWPGIGQGRYWKRRLSKARRHAWKNEVFYEHRSRNLAGIERMVNWKTW